MSEFILRSSDLIFEPEPEIVSQVIDSRHSNLISLGRQCLRGNLTPPDNDSLQTNLEMPVLLNVAKNPEIKTDLAHRSEIITEMVDTFADHDYVLQTIAKHRSSKRFVYSENLKTLLMNTAGMFNLLSRQETDDYFKQIDCGVELYESGIDLDNLTPVDEKIVLELVAARQVIFLTNLRLVLSVSKPHNNPSIDDVDIIEEGIIGLSKAVDRFDRSKKFQFSTYAHEWIFQGIMRAINYQSRLIRLPMQVHERYCKVFKQLEELAELLGRDPTDEEKFESTGMSVDDISLLMRHGSYSLPSLDAKLGTDDDNEWTLADFYGELDPNIEKVNGTPHYSELLDGIIKEANLDNRRMLVLGLRTEIDLSQYGDFEVKRRDGTTITYSQAKAELQSCLNIKYKDIANILGVTWQRTQNLEKSAMERLQAAASKEEFHNFWNTAD